MVANATISGLKPYADYVFSITSDNGTEFASHEKISMELGADFYFAHTSGLVRQYLKRVVILVLFQMQI
jgi:transposase, IS30 family